MISFWVFSFSDLTFKKGDVVTLRRQIDDNWYQGELRGQIGVFPASYVQVSTLFSTWWRIPGEFVCACVSIVCSLFYSRVARPVQFSPLTDLVIRGDVRDKAADSADLH